MANNISNGSSIKPAESECLVNEIEFQKYCLIPAILIITVLAFLNKRVRIKTSVCNGKPGLVVPVNFLGDNTSNRLSIAMAFGVLARNCFQLFDNAGMGKTNVDVLYESNNAWEKALRKVCLVLLYGIINFPILSCLTSEIQLIGSFLGLLYIVMMFTVNMVILFSCQNISNNVNIHLNKVYDYTQFFLELPSILCQVFLIVRFTMILHNEILTNRMVRYRELERQSREETERKDVASKHDLVHVDLLLKNNLYRSNSRDEVWYIRLRDAIYKTRPDFKYSTELICTLVVGAFIVYHVAVYLIIEAAKVQDLVHKGQHLPRTDTDINTLLASYQMFLNAFYISMATTIMILTLLMLHFMKCHRRDVFKIYKERFFPNNINPSRLVGRSLSYPGYQIAYLSWGFIIMLLIIFVLSFIVISIIQFWNIIPFLEIFLEILPIIVIPLATATFQYILGRLVFRNRDFPDITFTIDNHRLYSIMSYFFFFFNILVGVFSSLFRCLKSMALGVFFLSRLDRTPMMAGYHNCDKGYLSYIGFLNKLKSSSHPVMLVFCHLLVNKNITREQQLDNYDFIGASEHTGAQRSSLSVIYGQRRIINRWLVLYTLHSNPGLKSLRKQNLNRCYDRVVDDTAVLQARGLGENV